MESDFRKRNENDFVVIYGEDPGESGAMVWTESLFFFFLFLFTSLLKFLLPHV